MVRRHQPKDTPMPAAEPAPAYDPAALRRILEQTRTIAAVGVSTNTVRPSYYVVKYLKAKGYRIVPVNPVYAGQTVIDEPFVGALSEVPADADPVDMVEIFRNSEAAGGVVDEAIEALKDRGLRTIWMQIGVINRPAAKRAEAAGIEVVMNRCPKIEYARLFGELRWGGFNTGVISSKLR